MPNVGGFFILRRSPLWAGQLTFLLETPFHFRWRNPGRQFQSRARQRCRVWAVGNRRSSPSTAIPCLGPILSRPTPGLHWSVIINHLPPILGLISFLFFFVIGVVSLSIAMQNVEILKLHFISACSIILFCFMHLYNFGWFGFIYIVISSFRLRISKIFPPFLFIYFCMTCFGLSFSFIIEWVMIFERNQVLILKLFMQSKNTLLSISIKLFPFFSLNLFKG